MAAFFLFAAAVVADPAPDIIVNAALVPQPAERASASTTVIPEAKITALGEPLVSDLLRLTPGLSVSASGGPGSQVQIRVRGAEANHTLLFLDGIQFNDPASSDEARFESLQSNGLGRIEVIRGPQSALFGSEALGGVIALDSPDPLGKFRASAEASYGSLDTRQVAASVVSGGDKAGITASGSWIKSDGIDILGGGHGDKDGYENKTFSFKAIARPGDIGEFGLVGRYIDYRDQFDGTDPITFLRADTLDNSHAVTKAIRGWATLGRDPDAPLSGTLEAQYLYSDNKNFNDRMFLNRTAGDRLRVAAQGVSRFVIGGSKHSLILRLEREDETFIRRDVDNFGATDLDRDRGRSTIIGEWQAGFGKLVDTDLAVRHDNFSDFRDATTIRAGAVVHLTSQFALTGSYGDGISQPTFDDLFGFFPGSYVGNPDLKPEQSRGFEAGVRWRSPRFDLALTAFSNRLKDETLLVFGGPPDFLATSVNATGKSRRRGIELTGEWRPSPASSSMATIPISTPMSRRPLAGARVARGAPAQAYGESFDDLCHRPADARGLGRLCRQADRQRFRLLPGAERHAAQLCAGLGARCLSHPADGRAVRPRRQSRWRQISGPRRLCDGGTDGLRWREGCAGRVAAQAAAGGSAIIAVKPASAQSSPSTNARPANLQIFARFWTKLTSSVSNTPGSTGRRNFASSIAMK